MGNKAPEKRESILKEEGKRRISNLRERKSKRTKIEENKNRRAHRKKGKKIVSERLGYGDLGDS